MSTSPGPAPEGGSWWGQARRTWFIVAGVVVVVIAGLIIWSVAGDDDTTSTTQGGDPGSSDSKTTSPKASNSTASPGSKASGSPGKGSTDKGSTGGPVNQAKPQQVQFDQTGRPALGVNLDIVKIENVRGEAQIPGEVSGPALRITVQVSNRTKKPVTIDNVVSNLYYGPDRRPATPMLKPGSRAFPSVARPNGTASGVLLFNVPRSGRNKLVLEVILDAKLRTVEFNGACPADC